MNAMDETLLEVHHKSLNAAMKEIVTPTIEAGGDHANVMSVLECTITGVLLHLYQDSDEAIRMLEKGLAPQITKRLKDHAAKQRGQI